MRRPFAWTMLCLMAFTGAPIALADRSSRADDDASFEAIARVLLHPRCLNCHTATDYPKQGDDRHPHWFRVVRGNDGHGSMGFPCATCHQAANDPNSNVPGAPNWHAAPRSMAWEGKTPGDVCRTLRDRRTNGDRSVDDLVEHVANDPLVAWGWSPGGSRQAVPMAKDELVRRLRAWREARAPCPK